MNRKELVSGDEYAWLPPKSMWEIHGELRRHERVMYAGTSCVGLKDKPGYVVIARSFSGDSQRLHYVKSSEIKMTWDAYLTEKERIENAANKVRAERRVLMEAMSTDIRCLFGPGEVDFDMYQGTFVVSISAMKYLLQLNSTGAVA